MIQLNQPLQLGRWVSLSMSEVYWFSKVHLPLKKGGFPTSLVTKYLSKIFRSKILTPWKLAWHWKLLIFNRKYIFIHGGFSAMLGHVSFQGFSATWLVGCKLRAPGRLEGIYESIQPSYIGIIIHPQSLTARPWKMVGLEDDPASYWEGNFSGANC